MHNMNKPTHIADYQATLERELYDAEAEYERALAAYELAEARSNRILTKLGADE